MTSTKMCFCSLPVIYISRNLSLLFIYKMTPPSISVVIISEESITVVSMSMRGREGEGDIAIKRAHCFFLHQDSLACTHMHVT